jgi:predicted dehydrogenase
MLLRRRPPGNIPEARAMLDQFAVSVYVSIVASAIGETSASYWFLSITESALLLLIVVDLCAVVGTTPERAAARASEFGTTPYADLNEMLERERPDLVSLCLAYEGHFDPTLQVIRAGFPLLVEKPLVFDLDQADVLLREAEARSLFFAINFNHRYATPVVMVADAVRAGDLGELIFATWRFGGEPGTSSHPHANLIETQCHGLAMLEHLCGPIDSVTAQMTETTCWTPSGRGARRLSTPGPAAAPWPSPTPSSARSRLASGSTSPPDADTRAVEPA